MNVLGHNIRMSALRGWVVRLLLFSIALRALIPLGYMPDVSAASKGVFKVVICTSTGTLLVDLDGDGLPVKHNDQEHHDAPCAFSGLGHIGLPVVEFLALQPLILTAAAIEFASTPHLPPARAGPAHGSRAPPYFS
jgi:hypothetical protein